MTVVKRIVGNPLIRADDITGRNESLEVIGAFNPGVTEFNGGVLLLLRVAERVKPNDKTVGVPIASDGEIKISEFQKSDKDWDFSDSRVITQRGGKKLLTSLSRLAVARSLDGARFELTGGGIFPETEYEEYGIEDPRITKIENKYYITYSAVSSKGICAVLRVTDNFIDFESRGVILCPDNKDAAIFPEKIGGRYYILHRPSGSEFSPPEIWLAESPDLACWGNHRHLMGVRRGRWDGVRIGSSSVPIKTDKGWLVLYHGADINNRYCLGAFLLDAERPWIVTGRTDKPFLEPELPYETDGFFGNVVFACGCVRSGDTLKIYYGAADDKVCRADVGLNDIFDAMR
ncbi:MAG: glycoside hydrolase family 130 protein [Clostridiales bacterium]|jgi:predicted GH43/DUF377 family glycosyl hydrolase|nr:glycoside hydrolase family 130 protein [Clostridiales bacterium]